ncbi:hypothetical protein [Streptomyces sp. NPDC048057]|uniref:hypothetical protein n=1 Tax=Streptomyces sp. NPDC048057 TaxID=3155628 RepID=UPI0033D75C8B
MNKFARIGVIAAALLGAAQIASPAVAATPNEAYSVCFKNSDCNMGYTVGNIQWDNYPVITGSVVNRLNSPHSTTAVFESYFHDTKVDSATRTSRDGNLTFSPIYVNAYNVNRIKITVCQNWETGVTDCGSPENYRLA